MFKFVILSIFCILIIRAQSEGDKTIVIKIEESRIGNTYHTPEGRLTVSTDKLYWSEALTSCNQEGMNLVTVDSLRKNNIVKELLVTNGHTGKYWTAGFQIYDLWFWTTLGYPVTFFDWVNGEPNEFVEYNCLYMEQNGWSDIDCRTENNYICE